MAQPTVKCTSSQYQVAILCAVRSGVIGLATAVFPSKIKGNCLDSFARKHLWDVGLDYLHGTGHGVGAFLNVHEGPTGISWKVYPNDPGTPPSPHTHSLSVPYTMI
jgi:Xaa-Pro aminopeptidase